MIEGTTAETGAAGLRERDVCKTDKTCRHAQTEIVKISFVKSRPLSHS